MFCSVKTDEGNDAALHLSLRSPNVHLRIPLRQVPIRPMQHIMEANKKGLVQRWNNAVAHI